MLRSFAIVPAAGLSARFGAPKLLLPIDGVALIERVLSAWTRSAVTRTIVVVRAADESLLERCRRLDVDIVAPAVDPADMKASVQLGLGYVAKQYGPRADEAWLVAPADLPRLSAEAIDLVLAAHDPARPAAIMPVAARRRGHPALLPWSWAEKVSCLEADEGVDALLKRLPVREVFWGDGSIVEDVDTAADYARLASG